jgi:predicted transcriptional regulator
MENLHAQRYPEFLKYPPHSLGVDIATGAPPLTNPSRATQLSRKSPVQIRFEILEFLFYNAGAHSRTALWRHATQLSYDDFQKYLDYLKNKGFVEESEGGIHLSAEGKDVYVKLRETLPSIL